MNLSLSSGGAGQKAGANCQAAFTLPEMLIAVVLFLLVVGGVVGANLFGLRMYQIIENKLTATMAARKAIGIMTEEVRNCRSTCVGNISNGVFVAHLDGEAQTGSGLMIYPTTNAAKYVLYFVNPSDQSFRRTTSTPGTTQVLARSVTNTVAFRARDCFGNVLTNNQNNRVIHLNLDFFRSSQSNVVADYYRLETSVTKRALD